MLLLNNVAVGDAYTVAATLGPVATTKNITVLVANASAIMQVAKKLDSLTESPWGEELLVSPSTFQVEDCSGVRFKNAVSGSVARVIAQLSEPADVTVVGANPYAATLLASGSIKQLTNITPTALASWPPLSPADGQIEILELPVTFDPSGTKLTRWMFQWNATDARWDFLGGPPLVSMVDTAQTTASAAYVDLATAGPSITIPRGGDYVYTVTSEFGISIVNQTAFAAVKLGAAATADLDAATMTAASAAQTNQTHPREREVQGAATNDIWKVQYRITGAATLTAQKRTLTVVPVRIT